MRLEHSLVLNRYLHDLFGARDVEDLKEALTPIEEGTGPDGQSRFFHALAGRKGLRLTEGELRECDARIVGYEARLAKARRGFAFKYFQYLALLYTEILLSQLTEAPDRLLRSVNAFLARLRQEEISLGGFPVFTPADLRRLAFFMATGSGKTLLMHVNLWQVLHYLEQGRHPEALVARQDLRREFDTILLVTPNEGLSRQHLEEFQLSGIDAALLVQDRRNRDLFGPRVAVVEIHKLAEEPSKEGVSVLLDELGGANLVFVDEGHKGTGSEAQTWKRRQRRLSADGFLLEYSATFAQSIAAATTRARDELLAEYGKAIVFDYSYPHFYGDGYGKDFRVLNLARARQERAHDLLLGGLLTYYHQVWLYRKKERDYRPYNLERPLWVFLGSSVSKKKGKERDTTKTAEQERSDVATVVAFLKRFLEDRAWAVEGIRRILKGKSGFTDQETHQDLFEPHVPYLRDMAAEDLYKRIAADVFHGRGGLEVRELKGAEGELALRVSSPEGKDHPYFGVVNIGDVGTFRRHLEEQLKIQVGEDRFTPSLFSEINAGESHVNVLVGAKKFIEGWSSWRVSAMGLLNIGKGEGPQVIQLFGRGVRLKGKGWSLKRSAALLGEGPHPDGLDSLETLFVFGWNADYVQTFREILEREDIGREVLVPVKTLFQPWPKLPIPKPREGYRVEAEIWVLQAELPSVRVDLMPKVTAITGAGVGEADAGDRVRIDFSDPATAALVDVDALYAALVEYKSERRYGNVYVPRDQVLSILRQNALYIPKEDLSEPRLVQDGASRLLKTYLDRFVARKRREGESRHLVPGMLSHEAVTCYRVRVSSEELLKQVQALLRKPKSLYADGLSPLPRLHIDRHLFTPLLLNPRDYGIEDMSVSPAGLGKGEAELVTHLRTFWAANHAKEPYQGLEIFLVRNLPKVGVGFFKGSGFYPDFILWIKERHGGRIHIRFLEPHGLHHGGLEGNEEKFEAFRELQTLSKEPIFAKKKIVLSGYVLGKTPIEEIPGARGKTLEELERTLPLLRQEGAYIQKLLSL